MKIQNVAELEQQLSRPREADVAAMADLKGDLLILGVGGKMGPSLAALGAPRFRQSGRETPHHRSSALQQL